MIFSMRFSRLDDSLILCVESETKRRGDFSAIAKSLRVRANCVSDLREAVDCMTSSAYSFMFISIAEGDVEALACIKSLRLNAARLGRSTAIIAVLPAADKELERRLMSSGVSDVVCQPLTADKMRAVLSRRSTAVA
jgi:PleD family two-component response regulator